MTPIEMRQEALKIALEDLAADLGTGTVEEAAKLLGIPTEQYKAKTHWPRLLAREMHGFTVNFLEEWDTQARATKGVAR
jgi:hypothetical protein